MHDGGSDQSPAESTACLGKDRVVAGELGMLPVSMIGHALLRRRWRTWNPFVGVRVVELDEEGGVHGRRLVVVVFSRVRHGTRRHRLLGVDRNRRTHVVAESTPTYIAGL